LNKNALLDCITISRSFPICGIQADHDELEAKFNEERAALEAKYAKLYEPLYVKVCKFILIKE